MDTTQHTNRPDTRAQNQETADEFYRQLDAARPARIAAIVREGDRRGQLDIIVRDSTRWRNARSRLDAQRRKAAAGRKVEERDRARYARTQRRHYVTAMTRSQLPPPRLGPPLSNPQKQRNNRAYWSFVGKMQNPSDAFLRRVSRDADSNYPLWELTHFTGGPVSSDEINRFRAQYVQRSPITVGRIKRDEIRPVGMSLQRALEIAAAALNRKDL
jgi:hypothetical protein